MQWAESMNLRAHKVLRDLRPAGSRTRAIPKGAGFDLVSCANYFYEAVAWTSLTVMTGSLSGAPRLFSQAPGLLADKASNTSWHLHARLDGPDGPLGAQEAPQLPQGVPRLSQEPQGHLPFSALDLLAIKKTSELM